MFERLTGRLKWERENNGIRVVIPARKGWLFLFLSVGFTLWLVLAEPSAAQILSNSDPSIFQWIFSAAWAVGALVVAGAILWALAGSTLLTLDRAQLRLERRLFGVPFDLRSFRNESMRNLRFAASYWSWEPKSRGAYRYHPSRMLFEAERETVEFASGINEEEAGALYNCMMDIYSISSDSDYQSAGLAL